MNAEAPPFFLRLRNWFLGRRAQPTAEVNQHVPKIECGNDSRRENTAVYEYELTDLPHMRVEEMRPPPKPSVLVVVPERKPDPIPEENPFADLRLERTVNGHVVTPWMSFDWKTGPEVTKPAHYGSAYHRIIPQAKTAFARLLRISEDDMIVSEQFDRETRTYRWRLGTKRPCVIPQPKPAKKTPLPESQGAIDV